jgi:hypothetical protein
LDFGFRILDFSAAPLSDLVAALPRWGFNDR